jgi:uncharacterized protein with PIN domain
MKCPHCEKQIYNHDLKDIEKAKTHAEYYGSGFTTSQCPFCKKKFRFYTEVKTVVYEPQKATDDAVTSFC